VNGAGSLSAVDQTPGTPDAGRVVTCSYVASAESNDREARALRRWRLSRPGFWLRWGLTWLVYLVAVIGGGYLLVRWLIPEASDFVRWAAYLVIVLIAGSVLVDAATLPQRWLRRFQKVVDRTTPIGTPVEQTFTADTFTVTTPARTFAVPTASITEASWLRDCLVLEGHADGAWVMNGDGIDDQALQVVIETLGDRLHQS
jgi:hypothetical protein